MGGLHPQECTKPAQCIVSWDVMRKWNPSITTQDARYCLLLYIHVQTEIIDRCCNNRLERDAAYATFLLPT